MNVHGYAACVRPQAVIDLLSVNELAGDSRGLMQERTEFGGLGRREVSYGSHMPFGLDDEGPEPERAYAVLNQPEVRPVNAATWQWRPPRG